jgi:hypothetical protein
MVEQRIHSTMLRISTLVLLILNLAHHTVAQEPYEFINPPARIGAIDTDETRNAVYTVGNSMNITWRSNASTISLTIRQSRANDPETDIGDMQYLPDSSMRSLTTGA